MGLSTDSKQTLEDFKTYIIVEKNFSKHTAKAYCSDVLSFLLWLDDELCEDVTFPKIRDYLHFIQNNLDKFCSKKPLRKTEKNRIIILQRVAFMRKTSCVKAARFLIWRL